MAMVEEFVREARHAARRLAKSPGFALAGVVTLGLAIGANAAIFTVVERVVLSPLPYADAERIVFLDHGAAGLDRTSGLGMTTGLYWQYRERSRTLRDVTLYRSLAQTETSGATAEALTVTQTTPSLLAALGVTPALGRWFTAAEGEPGGPLVAVVSHAFWQRRFGGSAAAVGERLVLSGSAVEIIGVMPRAFAFPDASTDVWIPHQLNASNVRIGGFSFGGVARLVEGATLEDARSELGALIARIPADFPDDASAAPMVEQARTFSSIRLLKDWIVGPTERTLWLLLAAVGVVLLVACANVANLFLVRAESRRREVAVRRALGATRRSVASFHIAETSVLALAGGALGLGLAAAGVRLLVAFGPQDLPRLHEVRLDGVVLLFTTALSVGAALVLGTLPLLRRDRTLAALRESGRANTTSAPRLRARGLLMGAQVAFALVLLVGSLLLIETFRRMRAADPGYRPENALVLRPGRLIAETYPTREAAAAFHERVLERVRALPGVSAAAATTCPPLSSFCFGDPVSVAGQPWDPDDMPPIASFRRISEGYFDLMGIRLLAGRPFDATDQRSHTRAIVIDERMADVYFPGQDALGQRIVTGHQDELPYEIVGIVNHVLTWGVRSPDRPPQVYLPLLSHTEVNTPPVDDIAYIVRTRGEPMDVVPAIRAVLHELDPDVPIADATTLEAMLAQDRAATAFTMTLVTIAGIMALVLSLIGIYAVVSYVVTQRTSEIGVRLAMGARPGVVAAMIVRQGGRIAALGLAVGIAASLAGSRALTSLLYGVSPTDARAYVIAALTLLATALLACWLPARRAARLDPLDALRRD